jgi:hypothetical protein
MTYPNICETCVLNGRCDDRCEHTDPLYYVEEELNDYHDEAVEYEDSYPDE